MPISVDPIASPRIITVPEADGASITIQSLVNQIREWEHLPLNLSYLKLLSASGKEDLGGGALVGITAKLENTKIRFETRGSPTTCYVGGGNLVAIDIDGNSMFPIEPSANITVQLSQSSSATMVQSADIDMLKQIELGRWQIIDNLPTQAQMVFYGNNGEPIRTFDLKDKLGNPAVKDVYERVPV